MSFDEELRAEIEIGPHRFELPSWFIPSWWSDVFWFTSHVENYDGVMAVCQKRHRIYRETVLVAYPVDDPEVPDEYREEAYERAERYGLEPVELGGEDD